MSDIKPEDERHDQEQSGESTPYTTDWRQPTMWMVIGSAISIWLDQWSKAWAAKALYTGQAAAAGGVPENPGELYTRVIEVTSWFNFRLVGNKGAAWGIFKDLPEGTRVPFFVILSAFALTILLVVYYQSHGQKLMQTALILICGGAVGNLIDRLQIGYVVDFIDWHIGIHHWPTFNVADISISVGVGLMVIGMIRQSIDEYRLNREESTQS